MRGGGADTGGRRGRKEGRLAGAQPARKGAVQVTADPPTEADYHEVSSPVPSVPKIGILCDRFPFVQVLSAELLMSCSPPGSFVHGILQARMLEWAAMPFVQGIFPTQGLNPGFPCLLHWQVDSLALSHVGPDVYCLPKLLLVLPSAG